MVMIKIYRYENHSTFNKIHPDFNNARSKSFRSKQQSLH